MGEKENKKGKKDYHGSDNKFKEGNPGGPGGRRVGAGRPPKPTESLLKELYEVLEKTAPQALKKLEEQINHTDPKVSQKACQIILSKILPERSANESWQFKDNVTPEEHSSIAKLLAWKREQDLKESKGKEKEATEEEEKRLKIVKGEGN